MLNEKAMCSILKKAYTNGGYTVTPRTGTCGPEGRWRRNDMILNGPTWGVICQAEELPPKVAVQISENVGYIPLSAVTVQKNKDNQTTLGDVAEGRYGWLGCEENSLPMRKIPVIFRERWQLYQTTKGDVYGFDLELLAAIEDKEYTPTSRMTEDGHLGIFVLGEAVVYIAPGRFSKENQEKLAYLAGLDWANQFDLDDPVVNVSLFDAEEDEQVMERE